LSTFVYSGRFTFEVPLLMKVLGHKGFMIICLFIEFRLINIFILWLPFNSLHKIVIRKS